MMWKGFGWRYGAWMAAKASLCTTLTGALAVALWPGTHRTFDAVLLGFWVVPMVWVGLMALAVRDQRRRCRTCARRLRMPVREGSYAAFLLRRPSAESICPWGHGALQSPAWIASPERARWREHGDMWQELFRTSSRTVR